MISAIIKSIKTAIEYSYSKPNIVKNGNFNLPGVELVTNGDFSVTGSELVTDGSFPLGTTAWNVLGTTSLSDGYTTVVGMGATYSSSANFALNQIITVFASKSYVVKFTARIITGSGEFYSGWSDQIDPQPFQQNITSSFVEYTYYKPANTYSSTYNTIAFSGEVGSTFEIKDITVKELGEDWTVYTDNDGVVEFNSQGVKITNGAANGQAKISQSSVFESGKSYKFTYTIVEYNGGDIGLTGQSAAMSRDVGTHVEYIVGGATSDFILGKANTNTDVTVTNISLQEVGQDWTVGAGWSIGDQKLIANDPTENTSQSGVFESGVSKYYKINLKVSDYTSGSFKVITSGNTAQSQTFTANNDFEFELLSNNPTGTDLIFSFDGDFIGSISEVSVKERITESPELTKVRTLCSERVYALKQADGANTPCVIVQLVGCEPNHTKDGGSSTEVNEIEITCIASHPRTAFQMAALLRMGFNKSKILTDKNEGVTIDEMIFLNWASDVFEPTDMYTMTLRFEAFSSLRQDLTNYL